MKKTCILFLSLLVSTPHSFAQALSTNILAFTNAAPSDVVRVDRALELIEEVVNSNEFRSRVLNMSYRVWGFTRKGYAQTNLSARAVLDSILLGRENFNGGKDGQIDLFLDMFYEESNTIGYTAWNDKFVHMNRYFHQDYTPVETAGNLFHEWLHKLGHDHSRFNSRSRPHSVPYKLGYLVSEMAAEIEAGGDVILKGLLLENFHKVIDNCSHHD